MIVSLEEEFADMRDLVRWNRPKGGFFLTLTLPFVFGVEELQECAADYGIIVCPMQYFSLRPGCECQVRLSFSYVDDSTICTGVKRFASYVRKRLV